ncbi:hypothetical protein TSTA_065540 [Talaromyces stipitatus ATCC 10500]|uniref:Uncharacterized protein n=1 Tax=Talaromyces stipitatus (strain ATCC 10500 / CBS 375.48 / QM 6759 / NRRL 1006) TaxID=441959 RepID=B8LV49_TALSN|nr:uncharacterized protein TSTA_065540 [Talaromyces stipitatus ATCC 10500]EED23099.1 hypothetical protein TSTA_065540 [Talaromyces stipitatus ATCC 10500]
MEHHAKDRIDRILDRIHSLEEDLAVDDIIELRRISESSRVLDKFKVSRAEYWNWLDKIGDDTRGVEYDAQNARIVLKGGLGWMHEAAADVVRKVLYQIRDRLNATTGSRYFLTGSIDMLITPSCCSLPGDFDGSTKQADASPMEYEAKWPAVVLEIGISETTSNLYKDTE